MANSLYEQLEGNKSMPNIMSRFQQFMQNPFQTLMSSKLNIPPEMQNNPQEAVQHLVNSGQVSQETLNRAFQMARRMGVNI